MECTESGEDEELQSSNESFSVGGASDTEKAEQQPEISIHALSGSPSSRSMRILGRIGGCPVVILLDTSSTHCFMDSSIQQRARLQSESTEGLQVKNRPKFYLSRDKEFNKKLRFCCLRRNSINRPPTPDDAVEEQEDQEKQPTLQEIINIKLIESGEKERLMELLRERLIECGWKDEMKALCSIIFSILKSLSMSLCCRAFIKKKGSNNVTVDDLVHVITPKGRGGGSSVSEVYLLLSTQDNLLVYLQLTRIQMPIYCKESDLFLFKLLFDMPPLFPNCLQVGKLKLLMTGNGRSDYSVIFLFTQPDLKPQACALWEICEKQKLTFIAKPTSFPYSGRFA
ncbi:hypothetical protein DKX38_026939 [Salix brachista]|uniref:Transcription and mRNA export factor ENY2 n=1 Tax=Salix brachista TaxID=2182728 RepID=A0A5N5JAY2_9ROSI|nr:hypothetical protein DKX38_026939 [Salix brachista]